MHTFIGIYRHTFVCKIMFCTHVCALHIMLLYAHKTHQRTTYLPAWCMSASNSSTSDCKKKSTFPVRRSLHAKMDRLFFRRRYCASAEREKIDGRNHIESRDYHRFRHDLLLVARPAQHIFIYFRCASERMLKNAKRLFQDPVGVMRGPFACGCER